MQYALCAFPALWEHIRPTFQLSQDCWVGEDTEINGSNQAYVHGSKYVWLPSLINPYPRENKYIRYERDNGKYIDGKKTLFLGSNIYQTNLS